jgi:NAD(P)-dependent dehydrogenase (short-subunit alcohol dehydrogenase family)
MNAGGRLIDKKVLVTGSGTGIGREIALEFARQGADIALHCWMKRGSSSGRPSWPTAAPRR